MLFRSADNGVYKSTYTYKYAIDSKFSMCLDTDNDGIPDIDDLDDDNDGVTDDVENNCENKRILVFAPTTGDYNQFYLTIEQKFTQNGYVVVKTTTLPTSIVYSGVDRVNGYDAFYMFGAFAYNTTTAAAINSFLAAGGSVFLNSEVSCCETSDRKSTRLNSSHT